MPLPTLLSHPDRERGLAALAGERFDCVVIGGGITGAGIARETARRGGSVALLEAEDFASGTSSRSSKLIHGGLRYLSMGDIALVRETALERKRVHRLAPHLAEPRWLLVPARSWAGLAKLRAGLATYEKLGAVDAADRHRVLDAAALLREEPSLRRERFAHGALYREYLTDDARLVLANLRDAAAHGARLLPHAPVRRLLVDAGRAAGVVAHCAESDREIEVRARVVVNAAGPWVEAILRLEDPAATPLLHLSKGVHVGIPRDRLPLRHIGIVSTRDRRSIFAIPRGEVVYVGTTDTSFDGPATHEPPVERADVTYLLDALLHSFDIAPLEPRECVSAWAGLRPLIAQPGKAAAEISRRDEVLEGPAGVVTIAGGKLTGYRKMAADVAERVARRLGRSPAPRDRDEAPLPGGDFDGDCDGLAARLAASFGLDDAVAARLARLYGSEAAAVLERGADAPVPASRVVRGEIEWAVDVEAARHVADVVYRRLRVPLYELGDHRPLVAAVAERMRAKLGWDAARVRRETDATLAQLGADLSFASEESAA